MPIYEYACEACDHQFELIQRVGAPVPESCPSCGEPHVRKLVSSSSFVLKGSGWYKDGYGLGRGSGGDSGGTLKPTAKETSTAKAAAE
jgi:putative FmdB family regulatory protein